MPQENATRRTALEKRCAARRAVAVLTTLLSSATTLSADQLPVRSYTTKDGLASVFVHRITRDSRGFLWFATREGLSRFDGARFVSYSIDDGLSNASVYDVLETRDGTYWIATNGGGVCRFDPQAGRSRTDQQSAATPGTHRSQLFTTYLVGEGQYANQVNALFEDSRGAVWAGTDEGVFRLERGGSRFERATLGPPASSQAFGVRDFAEDAQGNLWIATANGVFRRRPDGESTHFSVKPRPDGTDNVYDVRADRAGRLWFASPEGLIVYTPAQAAGRSDGSLLAQPGNVRWYTNVDGLGGNWVMATLEDSNGTVWIATREHGLYRMDANGFHPYGGSGLAGAAVTSFLEDHQRHLWVATTTGALELVTDGLTSYGPREGVHPEVHSVHEDASGRIYAVTGPWAIARVDPDRLVTKQPDLPQGLDRPWASQAGFLDRSDRWWLLTTNGLYRTPPIDALDRTRVEPMPFPPAHPFEGSVFRLFEERAGFIWAALRTNAGGTLARWDRARDDVHLFTEEEGLPRDFWASAFAEDAQGNIWIGGYQGRLARYRDGHFTLWTTADGVPAGFISALHVDRSGRPWIATNQQGVSRIEVSDAETLRFITYTTAQGLKSNNVRCITEDDWGRLYLGTGRGIDRLDPQTGYVKHLATPDGLAGEFVVAAHRDRAGTLWFAALGGLSRYVPRPDDAAAAPRVYVSGVSLSGAPHPLSALGETEVDGLTLAPDQNRIAIEFFALGARIHDVRYQYRLAGLDAGWTDTPERTVTLARMAPGSYRFEVRALAPDGSASERPAVVAFTILPPVYARPWFVSLAVLTFIGAGYTAYRLRLARLLDLERVRSRIATDLHDDIGASLSQIAVVSEAARQRAGGDSNDVRERLELIAATSRDLVDAMSDVVWAINPARDSLSDLVHRMRRFANDVLTALDIDVSFNGPSDGQQIKLGADVRRELFLLFKEAVNNCARHSRCTNVEIAFRVARHEMTLRVRDNGRGFDTTAPAVGTGLVSLRRRAQSLGGTLALISAPGQGTTIELVAPVHAPRVRNYLFRRRSQPGSPIQ